MKNSLNKKISVNLEKYFKLVGAHLVGINFNCFKNLWVILINSIFKKSFMKQLLISEANAPFAFYSKMIFTFVSSEMP